MTDTAPRPGMAARRTVTGDLVEWLDVPSRARALGMEPHPEGGWYVRTWTSPATVQTPAGERPAATLIHFLLPPGESSAWHRVASDEIWMWHGPDSVELELGGSGDQPEPGARITLGPDAGRDRVNDAQAFVRGGVWQRTIPHEGEVLLSCLVSPGFSFEDFTLAV
ncbi:cupin domain-containing protein [Curtobacterium sp. CFBP9011]|uniref:cupin domain-containing protein n=1 Tax=Curtobacterium sp. CFBP9011 TaxID=3096530 RepID=UPI002A6997BD|nr:cupin domain-containing protein [Curtobacterium sp. CFBP9011]MDY1006354.1 cupin domain-containing protein [Curtobacterium sp. CFBP9011]